MTQTNRKTKINAPMTIAANAPYVTPETGSNKIGKLSQQS